MCHYLGERCEQEVNEKPGQNLGERNMIQSSAALKDDSLGV